VPHTPHHTSQVCTHERGVGTTVCLHCRREARIAAQDKRQRLMLRGAAVAIVAAVGLGATAVGAAAIRAKDGSRRTGSSATQRLSPHAPVVARSESPSGSANPSPVVTSVDSTVTVTPAPPVAVQPSASSASSAARAPISPVIPAGASPLADGVSAFRIDSAVTVSFDLPSMRTRMPEKFERVIRATLPSIYGPAVDSVLARVPAGAMARQGDLMTELPSRGIRIPVSSAWELRVYPETRQGQDGPLVVRYRAVAVLNAGL
jgi:hypothetical protein